VVWAQGEWCGVLPSFAVLEPRPVTQGVDVLSYCMRSARGYLEHDCCNLVRALEYRAPVPSKTRRGGHFCSSSVDRRKGDGQIRLMPSLCITFNYSYGRVNVSLSHTHTHAYTHLSLLYQRVLYLSVGTPSPVHILRATISGNEYKCLHKIFKFWSFFIIIRKHLGVLFARKRAPAPSLPTSPYWRALPGGVRERDIEKLIWLHRNASAHAHTYAYTHTNTHTRTHAWTLADTDTRIHAQIHRYTQTQTQTQTQIQIPTQFCCVVS